MNSFLKASANAQFVHNNNIIDETSMKAIYDGEDLNIITENNNNMVYIKLNNQEILDLLAIPANPLDLFCCRSAGKHPCRKTNGEWTGRHIVGKNSGLQSYQKHE